MRSKCLPIIYLLLLSLAFSCSESFASANPQEEIMRKARKTGMPFVTNEGQVDKSIKFYTSTMGGRLFVTDEGALIYALLSNKEVNSSKGFALRETFVGRNPQPISGQNKTITKVNYFKGDRSTWRSNIVTYEMISLGEIYEGINLKLKAYGDNVEKLFYLKQGASAELIRVDLQGAHKLTVLESGELEVTTELGSIRFTKPVAYQEVEGEKKFVDISYQIKEHEYGFLVGVYDRSRELIIDPLLASTFLGGEGKESISDIVVDADNNVFITGATGSGDFPITPGVFQTTYSSGFIAKFNSDLTSLLATTYFGDNTFFASLAIDQIGNIVVAGGGTVPTTPNAYDTAGLNDPFIAKFDKSLSTLLASTYLGGSSGGTIYRLLIAPDGSIFVAGSTAVHDSTDVSDFPTTPGAFDTSFDGLSDMFISKLDSDLTTLLASTFLGGWQLERLVNGLVMDSGGNIIVLGETSSSDFPATASAYEPLAPESNAIFFVPTISKLSNDLSSLLASTFFYVHLKEGWVTVSGRPDIAIGENDSIYITAGVYSTKFETTPGAYDTEYAGKGDAYIVKFDNNLAKIEAATYLGGTEKDIGTHISIDSAGNAVIFGRTYSQDMPISGSGSVHKFLGNLFVAKMDGNLTSLQSAVLVTSTPISSPCNDNLNATAFDVTGNIYMAGSTCNPEYPTTFGAYSTVFNNGPYVLGSSSDAVLSKFDADLKKSRLLSPKYKEIIPTGSDYPIEWVAPSTAAIFDLYYSVNSGLTWKLIQRDLTNTSYLWPVPAQKSNETGCKIKIIAKDSDGKIIFTDIMKETFTLEVVEVKSPIADEMLKASVPYTITWSTYGTVTDVASVKVTYSLDGGLTWKLVPSGAMTGNPGSLEWTPLVTKEKKKCKIKVVLKDDKGNVIGKATNPGYFTVQP